MSWEQFAQDHTEWEDDQFVEQVRDTGGMVLGGDAGLADQAARLAAFLLADDVVSFELALEEDDALTRRRLSHEGFCRLVLIGLERGVEMENVACANYLGALYYVGAGVPQDFHRARKLFEFAEERGNVRAMVNLGYILEYGRTGDCDYLGAYFQYAKAAAISGDYEALYKLGDMYARGQMPLPEPLTAMLLYDRSLQAAQTEVEKAQPAFRIAELISDPTNLPYGIPYDPLAALGLYQLAERGLRVDIARGQVYYTERLQAAVQGQERMREVLEEEGCEGFVL